MTTLEPCPLAGRAGIPEISLRQSAGRWLIRRTAWIGGVLLFEILLVSLFFDTSAQRPGLIELVDRWGATFSRSMIVAGVVFAAFGFARAKPHLVSLSLDVVAAPISWWVLASHLLTLAGFATLSWQIFGDLNRKPADAVVLFWVASGLAVALSCIFTFLPAGSLIQVLRLTGSAWAYAVLAGALTYPVSEMWSRLWTPTAEMTFRLVAWLLRPLMPGMVVDSAAKSIGTERFAVAIFPQCSGLEGAGLILIFCGLWLWMFREEYRVGRALLAVPLGVLALWLLNALRIGALILIGNAGAASIAVGGFHSQAGWIAFNGVALGLIVGLQRTSWVKKSEAVAHERIARSENDRTASSENPVAAYLMPFLMILAAGMISRAASGPFEWLYPLRFAAAAAALLYYRPRYSAVNWKFGPAAVFLGTVVFALWLLLDRLFPGPADNGLGQALRALSGTARVTWLSFRVLAAVITVPIAEELAFRGFLLRRLMAGHFEKVTVRQFNWLALAVSSIAFGLMHGDRWLAGTAAGAIYAFAFLRRGRLGDAIAAHATTNALLAGWVLLGGNWKYW
jgi:exosortase E/protease (VPEID-CTERM system)